MTFLAYRFDDFTIPRPPRPFTKAKQAHKPNRIALFIQCCMISRSK